MHCAHFVCLQGRDQRKHSLIPAVHALCTFCVRVLALDKPHLQLQTTQFQCGPFSVALDKPHLQLQTTHAVSMWWVVLVSL